MNSNTGKTCFEDVDFHDINDHLSTGLFWSTYTIIKSPADGHCFMHSVVTTFNANMSDNIGAKLDVDVLSAKLSNETMANSHEYMNYIEFINYDDGTGIPSLRHHVREYVQHKNYNNLYGDIVPVIVANALMLNILIVEQTGNTYKLHLVKPRHDIGSSILHRTLILHKKNAHYDVIVPSSQSAYVITHPALREHWFHQQVQMRTMLLSLVQRSLLRVYRAQIMLMNVIPLIHMYGMMKSD